MLLMRAIKLIGPCFSHFIFWYIRKYPIWSGHYYDDIVPKLEMTTSQTRWMKFLLLSCQSLYKFWCHFRVQVKFESHYFTVLDHIILMFLITPPQYSIIFSGKNVGLLLWKIWKARYKTKDWYSLAERKSYCIFSHDSISYLKSFCTNGCCYCCYCC